MKDYKTAKGKAFSEFTEKKSRFLSYLSPVESEKEAVAFISEISSRHREAAHTVYAYSLLEGQMRRYSDAGEPQGTAGMPTLDVLLRKDLYNVAIATVRYFGGVLLGTGGLTRAYSKGAGDVVASAEIITRTWGDVVELSLPYTLYGKISPFLLSKGVPILNSDFGENVTIAFFSPVALTQGILEEITELSAATAKYQIKNQQFFDI